MMRADGSLATSEVTTNSPSSDPRDPLVQDAMQLLHKRLTVQLKDGRVLEGDFSCLDKQGNIILSNTYAQTQSDGGSRAHMGLVLVPAAHRVSCQVEVMPGEQDSIRALLGDASL